MKILEVNKLKEGRIKLLIVDDNRELADILGDYLEEKKKFQVVGKAVNGLEALKLMESIDIDLVILDLIMPKLDGIGVLEELSTRNLSHKPKIVVLSAVGGDDYTKRALSLGADYYIVKPFDMNIFASRMMELFDEEDSAAAQEQTAAAIEKTKPLTIDLETEVSEFLCKLGIPVNATGYTYAKEAVEMVINDITALSGITKIIYPAVADKYSTTVSRVERSIRHTIEILAAKNNTELWRRLFLNSNNKPTNGEFIGVVADAIRLKIKNSNE